MTSIDFKGLLLVGALIAPAPLAAKPPLSASDWLSGSVETPRPPGRQSAWRPGDGVPRDAQRKKRSDLAATGSVDPVGVTRLSPDNPDGKGTVSPKAAGLPTDLWGASDGAELARLIQAQDPRLPATRRLLRRLLAAQLAPPSVRAPEDEGRLFLARVDKLLDMGATSAAQRLLRAAGSGEPERFRRLFDIALLSDGESEACEAMDTTPGIAPSFPARIFCLAQSGDWAAASLVAFGAETLGRMDPETTRLLSHFLDDGFADTSESLPPPATITPLTYHLYETIGQPLPSTNLPLAFALFDLGENNGWKARLDAAERLARVGAIPATQLRDIYTTRKAAASGGVWDRVAAFQALDQAARLGDRAGVEAALPPAFDAMAQAGLATALADMVAEDIAAMPLEGRAGQIALWLALAAQRPPQTRALPASTNAYDAWLVDFAQGKAGVPPAGAPPAAAEFALAFSGKAEAGLAPANADLIAANRRGEALLIAMSDIDAGVDLDVTRAARGMKTLRALGQGDIARQAAVELLLDMRINKGG